MSAGTGLAGGGTSGGVTLGVDPATTQSRVGGIRSADSAIASINQDGSVGCQSTASNALSLGGVAASGYTQSICDSLTGAVKGFAFVPASSSFSSSFVNVGGYNCSGGEVEAKRDSTGDYELEFIDSTVGGIVGNALITGPAVTLTFAFEAPGEFGVGEYDPQTSTPVDAPFFVMAP